MRKLWKMILILICDTFDHKPNFEKEWKKNGKSYTQCLRCKRTITKCYDMAYGCTYWI